MRTIFSFLFRFPEYLLMLSVIFYWFSASVVFNPVAIVLMGILILQVFIKSKFIGIGISAVLIFSCFFMLLALFSEFSEFPSFTPEAQELLFVGLSFFLSTLFISAIMIFKTLGIEPNFIKLQKK